MGYKRRRDPEDVRYLWRGIPALFVIAIITGLAFRLFKEIPYGYGQYLYQGIGLGYSVRLIYDEWAKNVDKPLWIMIIANLCAGILFWPALLLWDLYWIWAHRHPEISAPFHSRVVGACYGVYNRYRMFFHGETLITIPRERFWEFCAAKECRNSAHRYYQYTSTYPELKDELFQWLDDEVGEDEWLFYPQHDAEHELPNLVFTFRDYRKAIFFKLRWY